MPLKKFTVKDKFRLIWWIITSKKDCTQIFFDIGHCFKLDTHIDAQEGVFAVSAKQCVEDDFDLAYTRCEENIAGFKISIIFYQFK